MAIWKAQKTLDAIDEAICADGGNAFRRFQAMVLPHIGDAYRDDEDNTGRTHLGASKIGGKCERSIFYDWRWVLRAKPRGRKGEPKKAAESRMRRLWNRGHLEEGRFIAMLLMIGMQVYQQDAEGKQFRISAFGGHFGGAGDGISIGCPDLPFGVPCLNEFKTHSAKSFDDLIVDGVKVAKPEHYAQMQEYMHHFGLLYALYVAVNKDTDELWAEIVMYDRVTADHYLDRAKRIIFTSEAPARVRGASPGYFQCKYMCDFTDVCYSTIKPERNCRTCQHAFAMPDGTWQCAKYTRTLSKEDQVRGCSEYVLAAGLK